LSRTELLAEIATLEAEAEENGDDVAVFEEAPIERSLSREELLAEIATLEAEALENEEFEVLADPIEAAAAAAAAATTAVAAAAAVVEATITAAEAVAEESEAKATSLLKKHSKAELRAALSEKRGRRERAALVATRMAHSTSNALNKTAASMVDRPDVEQPLHHPCQRCNANGKSAEAMYECVVCGSGPLCEECDSAAHALDGMEEHDRARLPSPPPPLYASAEDTGRPAPLEILARLDPAMAAVLSTLVAASNGGGGATSTAPIAPAFAVASSPAHPHGANIADDDNALADAVVAASEALVASEAALVELALPVVELGPPRKLAAAAAAPAPAPAAPADAALSAAPAPVPAAAAAAAVSALSLSMFTLCLTISLTLQARSQLVLTKLKGDVAACAKLLGYITAGSGARFPTEVYTRGCHWIPRMFA
jgi:hypothetical protein